MLLSVSPFELSLAVAVTVSVKSASLFAGGVIVRPASSAGVRVHVPSRLSTPADSTAPAGTPLITIDSTSEPSVSVNDALMLSAQPMLPLFSGWTASQPAVERARQMVAGWDGVLARDSAPAAIYSTWRTIATPQERDSARPLAERQPLHEASLARAIAQLTTSQGADWGSWRWGRMHTRTFPHPLVTVFNLPTIERRGGSGTVAADGAGDELEGAHFTNHYAPDVPWPSSQRFLAAFRAKYGRDPGSGNALAYDAALLLADAIGRAPDVSRAAIRDALAETRDFAGATATPRR